MGKCYLLLVFCLLAGCGLFSQSDLCAEQASLRADVDRLKFEVLVLQNTGASEETNRLFERVAYLTPGDPSFSPIAFSLGYITVSLTNVRPYANGSKVTLSVGNILSAR